MNNINFNQTGGFPLSTNILDAMQDAYQLFNELGEAVGKNCIVSGCEHIGANVTDGVVVINGEIVPFKGSGLFIGATVVVRETIENKIFEDATSKPVIYQRYAQLTTGEGIPFNSLPRIKPMVELTKAIVPIGLISMWSGAIQNIPLGWVLCNGQNGTPDLRDRFIVGAGNKYLIGDTGGFEKVNLTIAQMPTHSHEGSSLDYAGDHSHNYEDSYRLEERGYMNSIGISGETNVGGERTYMTNSNGSWKKSSLYWRQNVTKNSGNHTHKLNIKDTGLNEAHENRPPYYALAFIMFKG